MKIQRLLLTGVVILLVSSATAQDYDEFIRQQNENFINFIDQKQKEFDEFRRKKNEEFARFIEKGNWEIYKMLGPVKRPIEKEVRPVIYNEKNKRIVHERQPSEVVPIDDSNPKPQPKPIVPIRQNDDKQSYSSFTYYGTHMKVRWDDMGSFKLNGITEKSLADGVRRLTNVRYNNLLSDCLSLRDNYSLCDWAYFQMLDSLASKACGKGSAEATFLKGVLFQQSGYCIRFARTKDLGKLYLFVKFDGWVFDAKSIEIDGKRFFLTGKTEDQLQVLNITYTGEQDMSLSMSSLPRFEFALSGMKTIKSQQYNFKIESAVNVNLIHFMNDYPSGYDGKDIMTKWAYYGNTPVSEEIKQFVYPQLREMLKNTNEQMAVNMLLNWVQPPYKGGNNVTKGVQMGFPYLYDDDVWGHDRAFFAEETFYYPGSDCEDHAILFSHLVRDLLGLDVVLVYYPNHLATAVCFNSDVDGDYIMVGNRKFVVADPTYTGAPYGETMPDCIGKKAKIILCNR